MTRSDGRGARWVARSAIRCKPTIRARGDGAVYRDCRTGRIGIECPHASEAYRGEIQELLWELEENHPGTRHLIMAGYEELAELAADRYGGEGDDTSDLGECEQCGSTTSSDVCRKCRLLESMQAV